MNYCDLYEDYAYNTIRYLWTGSSGFNNTISGGVFAFDTRDSDMTRWYIGCLFYCDGLGFSSSNFGIGIAGGGVADLTQMQIGAFNVHLLFKVSDIKWWIGCMVL